MGGWTYPQFIYKEAIAENLDDSMLIYFHDNLHILWNKINEGYPLEWSFEEVFDKHIEILREMTKRGVRHIAPINSLDTLKTESDESEYEEMEMSEKTFAYSVEQKMNGFHASIHKKGNEVKIFSEQKKDLTSAFPTLSEEIKKLSDKDFIIDGELIPYEDAKALGRNALMKYVGAVRSGKTPDDSKVRFHVWDIPYLEKSITDMSLSDRIKQLGNLKFSDRVIEIKRKIANNLDELKDAINWASEIPNSEGAVVKDLNEAYHLGENKSWRKYRKLTPLTASVLKKNPKKRGLYNYLIGIPATKKILDKRYIKDGTLILGHTFNTDKIFEESDKIKVLVEEIWRHKTKEGIHYSIHKPRVEDKTEEKLSTIDYLEEVVTSIGVAVTHAEIDGFKVLVSDELAEKEQPRDEGKEIEVKNFPDRMQENFKKMIGKWGKYTMQAHTRGESLHYDIRHDTDRLLEGITLFGRSIKDRLKIETERNNIRSTAKLPQPEDWLNFEGVTEAGGIGATAKYPGIFSIISKGEFTVHEVTDHKLIVEYKSDSGKVNKSSLNWAKKNNIPYADLPDNLVDLTGKYSWHIAHIGDRYIILFDKLK